MLIKQFIDKLRRSAGYYTGLLNRQGYNVEFGDIYGEFGLTLVEVWDGHEGQNMADFERYLSGAFKRKAAKIKSDIAKWNKINTAAANMPERQVTEHEGDVALMIKEIDELLAGHDKAVFEYMVHGGKVPNTPGYYNSVTRVRKTVNEAWR